MWGGGGSNSTRARANRSILSTQIRFATAQQNTFNEQEWLTFGEEDDSVEELPERDVPVAVWVDETEEMLDKVRVDFYANRIRKLFLQNKSKII